MHTLPGRLQAEVHVVAKEKGYLGKAAHPGRAL